LNRYNPTAIYEVDYIPLEPYKITAPTNPINIEYQGNLASVVSDVVGSVAELQGDFKSVTGTLITKDKELSKDLGDLTKLTTENKNTLVDAINELNSKPTGNPNDTWELIATHDFSSTKPFYSISQPFSAYRRLKIVIRSLDMHHTQTTTVNAAMLNLAVGGLTFSGYKTFGYRFNMMSTSTITSLLNNNLRFQFPLLSGNIPSSSYYPHMVVNGTIEINKSWWKDNVGNGFLPRRLWMDTELRVRDPNSSTMERLFERAAWEFPIGLNENYPNMITLSTDRSQGFTRGTIEVWGVRGDANDV
jgi:hypothetical protein